MNTDLDLDLVARSHGWYDLPPFEWDEKKRRLSFTFLDRARRPVRVVVREKGGAISTRAAGGASRAEVNAVVRRVLDLDADLTAFHAACAARDEDGFGWMARRGAGRILRAPTLFEDAVKVLATTNCTWALTRVMVTNLIGLFDRGGAFPDAAFVAGMPEARLRAEAKMGYRAPFLAAFAERVASGELDLARWEDRARPADEVDKDIRSVNGFGPYAAQTLGRLLGRHERLGLDSWSRKKVAELRFKGRKVKDARVERLYRVFHPYAGLAFWLDVTREWHAGKEELWPTP